VSTHSKGPTSEEGQDYSMQAIAKVDASTCEVSGEA